jgi:predicted ester cyclase
MDDSEIRKVARLVTFELFAKGHLSRLEELTSPDFVNHGQSGSGGSGRDNLKAAITRVRLAFPDFDYTLEHEMVEGEFVLHHLTARGIHSGSLFGYPPSGKAAAWAEMHLMRFAGSKMIEQWGVVDRLGLLQQLGIGLSSAPR